MNGIVGYYGCVRGVMYILCMGDGDIDTGYSSNREERDMLVKGVTSCYMSKYCG